MSHTVSRSSPSYRMWRMKNRSRLALLSLFIVLISLTGCGVPSAHGPSDTYGLDFSLAPKAKEQAQGAIIFFVDGLNAEIFDEMLHNGELPAIKKYFVDRGAYAPCAVASLPSSTLANQTSMMTGMFPGHHGVVGTEWFDRSNLLYRNYNTIAQKNTVDFDHNSTTIYEQLSDRTTWSLFFQVHRGASQFIENRISGGVSYFFGMYELTDRITLYRLKLVAEAAQARQEWPAFISVYMLAPDFRAYRLGIEHPLYEDAIRHADYQLGRVLGDLESAGLLDRLHLVLLSDHGMHRAPVHFMVENYLEKGLGLKLARKKYYEKTRFNQRWQYYSKYNVVSMVCGDGFASFYLRRPIRENGKVVGFDSWLQSSTIEDMENYPVGKNLDQTVNLPQKLLKHPAVDSLAFALSPDVVRVRLRQGEVEIRAHRHPSGTTYSYHLIEGSDPLGWAGHVPPDALAGNKYTGREWLAMTNKTDYPDLPEQIVTLFQHHRVGELVLFAADGYDFRDNNVAAHGGTRAVDMHVPFIIAGEGIPHGRLENIRTVDLKPTLLQLLGREVPAGLDGRPIDFSTVEPY